MEPTVEDVPLVESAPHLFAGVPTPTATPIELPHVRDWEEETFALLRSRKRSRRELVAEDFLDPARLAQQTCTIADVDRHADLERAIDANLDDIERYLAYASWLRTRGNPRGSLIEASRRCELAREEHDRMLACAAWASLVHAHAGPLLGPLAGMLGDASRARWRHGFIDELVFELGASFDDDGDPAEHLASALALPVCRYLRALAIGDIGDDELDYTPLLEPLRRAAPPHLRTLAIGPTRLGLAYTRLDARGLAPMLPQLESLELAAGELELGGLALPRVRRLSLSTVELARPTLVAILDTHAPLLEDLALRFERIDCASGVRDLVSPLAGARLPQLRRLAVEAGAASAAVCETLVSMRIVAQLEHLDLGTLDDASADVLVANATKFRHCARVVVCGSALPPQQIARIDRALPNLVLRGTGGPVR